MNNSEEINIESDHENGDECIGYYTRSKRRKLGKDGETFTSISHYNRRKRKNPIIYLPMEVLQAVFKHISHQELSETVRLVNHRFKIIAEDILNRSFKQIEKKMNTLILTTELSLQCTNDDMEIKCLVKLLNMVEILKLQCSLIVATVWRYIYNDYYKAPRSCIYAGQLLDVIFNFIDKFLHCPNILYAPAVIREHALPPEVTEIMQMTKSFCIHFDKVIEEPISCKICSGCKIIDILDCAQFSTRSVISENADDIYFTAEYNYFFRNSWFVALPLKAVRNMELRQKQRFMYMRLRRIVLAHTDMFLQQSQYEREVLLRPEPVINRAKRPGNNIYTGYGDVGNVFFYYGVMNDGAYTQKFNLDDDQDDEDSDEDVPNQAALARNSENDIFYRIPHLGFSVHVKIQCPLKHAPLKFLEKLNCARPPTVPTLNDDNATHLSQYFNLVFECEGACYPRLPTRFEYNIL